ncbi:MAG: hypothetical protein HPY66_2677 [Firmicutes bacterium]|nr:hypothetical protein [Bacillota bacterium]
MSLKYSILGLLTYAPMNGYYLKKIFDKSINHFWTANLSQIYRELDSLEKKGYVSSVIQPQDDRPDKRVYSITREGEKAFHKWLADFPETLSTQKRDEFMVRIFFGSRLEKAELKKQFKNFIKEREELNEYIAELKNKAREFIETDGNDERLKAQAEREQLFWHFTIKRAQMTNETLIRWAEDCLRELEESTT